MTMCICPLLTFRLPAEEELKISSFPPFGGEDWDGASVMGNLPVPTYSGIQDLKPLNSSFTSSFQSPPISRDKKFGLTEHFLESPFFSISAKKKRGSKKPPRVYSNKITLYPYQYHLIRRIVCALYFVD